MSRSLIPMLVLFAGAATALAQQESHTPPARTLKGDPDRPLALSGGGQASGNVTMSFVQSDGSDTVKVKIVDGEISAEVNGKAVPKDRIRQSDGKIEILDDKGEVEHTISVDIGDMAAVGGRAAPATRGWLPRGRVDLKLDNKAPQAFSMPAQEAPKVMLGITMSPADETTLDRLGVKEESGIFVDSVIEGLPAAKAGLEANDLLVEADGVSPLVEVKLREILRAKKPGDELKVKVYRKGGAQQFTVKLDAYDAEKLGHMNMGDQIRIETLPRAWQGFGGDEDENAIVHGLFGIDQDKLRETLEGALKQLQDESGDWKKIRAEVTEELQGALKEFEKHKGQFRVMGDNLKQLLGDARPLIRMRDGNALVAPVPPPAPDAPPPPRAESGQLDRIADQLERLNRRLDDLEKKLNEKR